jgi:hypothetical protein
VNPLSEQLSALSAKAKETEDTATAALEKNRAELDEQKAALQVSIDASAKKIAADADAAQGKLASWKDDALASVKAKLAAARVQGEAYHAAVDAKKAQAQAEQAEKYASQVIDLALNLLDEAQYAVIDAVAARTAADALQPSA